MEKIIKTLLNILFIYNNNCYIFTCTRDLAKRSGLTTDTVRNNMKKLLNSQIITDMGLSQSYGREYFHSSIWKLYKLNLSFITMESACGNPSTEWDVTKYLKSKEGTGD